MTTYRALCRITKLWVAVLAVASSVGFPRALMTQTAHQSSPVTDSTRGVLRPGDVIRLRIWREPDLSGDFPVDETGLVTFPKIGVFKVFEYSSTGLKAKLLDSYAVFLKNPSVEVTMLRRINILGAVQKPGLYPVDPTMTIADALAVAGGANPNGDQHHIELVRNGVHITENLSIDSNIAETPLRSGDQLFVPERSFVVRNSGLVATAISVGASLFIALYLRR
jgi:protein involved in polysaccharide export with SLBB domain